MPEEIERIHLRVHPDALTATGKRRPRTGMEAKFSVYHAVAVALLDGAGAKAQFSDARVADPRVVALRERVRAEADPAVRKDEVYASVALKNGQTLDKHIDHALGSLDRPMSDRDLERKCHSLADAILGHEPVDRLLQLCWNVTELDDAAVVLHASVPRNGARS